MMWRRSALRLLLFWAAVGCAVGSNAVEYTASTYPEPRLNFTACGRKKASWVCDPDGVLQPATRDRVDARIRYVAGACPFPCKKNHTHFQIGLAVMRAMYRSSPKERIRYALRFGEATIDKWQMDVPRGCQRAVLLILVINEAAAFMKAGSAAKRYITFETARNVTRAADAQLRVARPDAAAVAAVTRLQEVLCGRPKPRIPSGNRTRKRRKIPVLAHPFTRSRLMAFRALQQQQQQP